MLAAKLLSSLSGAAEEKLYVDDVFSAYTYTGNGGTLSINNGIDLAGKGGLVWVKARSGTFATRGHVVADTVRGSANELITNMTYGSNNYNSFSAFTSSGFTLGPSPYSGGGTTEYASWSFRKAPQFFDVVTYTGNGVLGRQIPHALGAVPGMVIVKCTNQTGLWNVLHVSLGGTKAVFLDQTTGPITNSAMWNNTDPTSSVFTVGNALETNCNGYTFVAYLFAHDPAADGMIQCGSFTTNGSGLATVNLGWEPQYVMVKSTSASGDWEILDQSRSWCVGASNDAILMANTTSAESVETRGEPNASGFVWQGAISTTHIYMAIRRPNKPPTVGTQVYQGVARTGTGATAKVTADFAPDLLIVKSRSVVEHPGMCDRLRGRARLLLTDGVAAESSNSPASDDVVSFDPMSVTLGPVYNLNMNESGKTFINYFFKRAPGVFDIVCYTGDGTSNRNVTHGLAITPELIIVRPRSRTGNWMVFHKSLTARWNMTLNTNDTSGDYTGSAIHTPSVSSFQVDSSAYLNNTSETYVAYLFATLAGVSKVGNYIGDGTNGKVINCGFSTGARFVMIKCTSAVGDWFVWDTKRGVVVSTDPHLSLNTTAVEVTTDDSIDPDNSGFIVNQLTATNINVNAASYIFLAFS